LSLDAAWFPDGTAVGDFGLLGIFTVPCMSRPGVAPAWS
jgi:hypothetical protein